MSSTTLSRQFSPLTSAGLASASRSTLGLVLTLALITGLLLALRVAPAQAGTVGSGSYTETLPAGGELPQGCGDLATNPRSQLTANAPKGPVPTNDWWSSILFKKTNCAFGEPLFAHPAAYRAGAGGLGISYATKPVVTGTAGGVGEYKFPYTQDVLVGIAGLKADKVLVDGWSDWTVTPSWTDGSHTLTATIGHGLPMSYYTVKGGSAQLTTAGTPKVWSSSGSRVGFTANGHDYVAYAPSGASWAVSGTTITSTLAGKSYFTVAVLPTTGASSDADRVALADSYGPYAHAHITGTTIAYGYNAASAKMSSTYTFTTKAMEGSQTKTVTALYPHQWKALAGGTPIAATYASPRGTMKTLVGVTSFSMAMTFHGILPELPAVADGSGADQATLVNYLNQVAADPFGPQPNDTYWQGKGLGRAARIADISDQVGQTATRDKALSQIKATLTDWFTASSGEAEKLFYYDKNWGTLIGFPASYGSAAELNDHHFHYGYYIAAAATLARFDPSWAKNSAYGGMVDLLIRDANNYDRSDTRFPYLRDFDIYAGHDWASGHGSFGSGNNQESSSEGMNFAGALIQWGEVTGNTAVRDAGIFIYTTQEAAIENYWFDVDGDVFPTDFPHSTVGMVWGDGGAYSTWFTAEPEKIQGINQLPITGSHLYLGWNPGYNKINYAEVEKNRGGAPTAWQDILWEFLALGDGDAALAKFKANPGFTSEEGETKAHTWHWIRNLAALGTVDTSVTADQPLATVFSKNGQKTYVAANVTSSARTVTFSDGTKLAVPAGKTATTGAQQWIGGAASGGSSSGGSGGSSPQPTSSPSATPSSSPTATASPTANPTQAPSFSLRLTSDGKLGAATSRGQQSLAAANGENSGGNGAALWQATGLTGSATGAATTFDLLVDAGSAVGNGVTLRVSLDLTGNGSWDRVETYHYYATDATNGYEHYTQSAKLISATGTAGNLTNGTVQVELWNAIGRAPSTVETGDRSVINLPYR